LDAALVDDRGVGLLFSRSRIMTPASAALSAYRAVAWLATPLLQRHMMRRAQRGREDPARLSERFGHAGRRREPGPLVWLHASSVGESLSVLSLIDVIMARWPALQLLLTTGTLSSAQLMAKRLPDRVIHQFVPIDLPAAVERFYDHWQPDLGLLVESELWPNLIDLAKQREIPLLLVNARISNRSCRAWRRSGPVIGHLLDAFDEILAQSPGDAARFSSLGAKRVSTPGNLKFAAAPLTVDSERLAELQARLANDTIWLAASTHTKEAASLIEAHLRVRRRHPHALTIVAPRHPQRSSKVLDAMQAAGLSAARQSDGADVDPAKDFYIADRLGELGLWYRLADVVFVGGSLIPKGGQNPIEPARLGCAILYGPHGSNFQKIAMEMQNQGAMIPVADGMALGDEVSRLLADPAETADCAKAAAAYAESHARVMENVTMTLAPYLDDAIARHEP
jgi:3-deoxy-D-manno-octulosonic-acid transferase